ncbi:hypothetical protein L1987_67168 [Smallanthus sonchifolius]|uniref:Uncharacterized protein n=1 Tax=Smallanthus sonchifolius TaxID=185202 RepID=A0ACB9BZ58_9ASTR|nr:hypothetical protein L1987_67168 [Smallanthus sonchifolius]
MIGIRYGLMVLGLSHAVVQSKVVVVGYALMSKKLKSFLQAKLEGLLQMHELLITTLISNMCSISMAIRIDTPSNPLINLQIEPDGPIKPAN